MSDAPIQGIDVPAVPVWLADALERLARGDPASLDGHLVAVGGPVGLENTSTTVRCHFVLKDGNGRPRVRALTRKLADQAIDYCIPRSRIEEAEEYRARTGSAEKFNQLAREAAELFTRLERSGEGGELLLYLLLELVLGIPQVLCKMPLKTNPQMHVHGTDGVHAKALDDGGLAVYWGESKMYATVNSAIDACMASLAPFLLREGGGDARRDLLLIRDNLDAGDQELTAALVRYFEEDDPLNARLEARGACLVGFSLEEYPDPFGEDGQTIVDDVASALRSWQDRIRARVEHHELTSFQVEVFCVPVPSVDEFRAALSEDLRLR